MTPSAAVRPIHAPPRMWAVVGMSARVSVNRFTTVPPSRAAKAWASADASGSEAVGGRPVSTVVPRPSRVRRNARVPSAARMYSRIAVDFDQSRTVSAAHSRRGSPTAERTLASRRAGSVAPGACGRIITRYRPEPAG